MKKWTKEEDKLLLKCFNKKNTYKEMCLFLTKRTERGVRARLNKFGLKTSDIIDYSKKYVNCNCKKCGIIFKKTLTEYNKTKNHFCSHSCSAIYNNSNRTPDRFCKFCNKKLKKQKHFCSNKCQGNEKRKVIFIKIENGDVTIHNDSYKRYLIDKHGEKCMECGWDKKHSTTCKVPIQMNHKDGNSENNSLDNLELLCPNCHSLTENYGSLNIGNGRTKRQEYREKQKKEKGFYI